MPFLGDLARRAKLQFFLGQLPKDARILEVGCADGWFGEYAVRHGWTHLVGVDIVRPKAELAHGTRLSGTVNRAPGRLQIAWLWWPSRRPVATA